MGRVEKSIEIKAPPEKVWEKLAVDRFQEWDEDTQKNVKSMEYTSEVHTPEDKYRVGAITQITENSGKQYYMEITESIENEKMVYHSDYMGPSSVTYTLEPVEAGTRITNVVDYELPWGILGKVLDKLLVQRMAEKDFERSLEKLKNILEITPVEQ